MADRPGHATVCLRHFYALPEGERLSASGNIQHGQALRLRFSLQNVQYQGVPYRLRE